MHEYLLTSYFYHKLSAVGNRKYSVSVRHGYFFPAASAACAAAKRAIGTRKGEQLT